VNPFIGANATWRQIGNIVSHVFGSLKPLRRWQLGLRSLAPTYPDRPHRWATIPDSDHDDLMAAFPADVIEGIFDNELMPLWPI
jgi:hypothetical protein